MPPFKVVSDFAPAGDQPNAIEALAEGVRAGNRFQTLLGITGSGKSATIAWTIEVGKDGGLKGAVVAVYDIEDKAFMDGYAGTEVVAEFCEFLPYSGVVVNTRPFKVENHDADPDDPKSVQGVLHNPHSFTVKGSTSATGFNIGLAKKGDKLDKPVTFRGGAEKDGFYRLQCDQHEFMQSFFLPVSNPHFAVVKDDGTFEIKDVPPGKHKVVAWHPFVGKGKKTEFEVEVADGGTANLKAELK